MSEFFRSREEYWDRRFAEDWDERGGPEQTRFFAEVALRALPDWIAGDIRRERLRVVDWGCAEGDATDLLARALATDVVGVDVAETALAKARQRFPERRFVRADLDQLEEYDVLFTSNTLEHFDNPLEVLTRLLAKTRRYAIVLVPFREAKRVDEHLATFDFNSFPLSLGAFRVAAFDVIDTSALPGTRWDGQQILLVYAHEERVSLAEHRLTSLAGPVFEAFERQRAALGERQREVEQLRQTISDAERRLAQAAGDAAAQVEEATALTQQLEAARAETAGLRAQLAAANAELARANASLAAVHDHLQHVRSTRAQKMVTVARALSREPTGTVATVSRWLRGEYRPLGIGLAGALSRHDPLWSVEQEAAPATGAPPARESAGAVRAGETVGTAAAAPGALDAWSAAIETAVALRDASGDAPLVALQVDAFDKGGLEEVVLTLARELHQGGAWRVVVLAAGPVGHLADVARQHGIAVIALHGDRRLLRAVLRVLPVSVANLHYSLFGLDEYEDAGVPLVYTVHNAYVWSDAGWVRERSRAYCRIQRFVAVSEPVRDFFTARFGVPADRVQTIPNGLDLERMKEVEVVPRASLGLGDDDVVFVNVAAVNWYKFHLLMVAAMERVVRSFPRARLLVVGSVQDAECLAVVKRAIAERGVGEHVRLLEYVPKARVLGILQAADCFLLPSLVEGWSIAAMEAMYLGLPLILSDVGSARAVIRDGDVGRIIRNPFDDLRKLDMDVIRRDYMDSHHLDNLDDLVKAMLDLCGNKAEWRRRAAAGRERILGDYTSAAMARAYAECFRQSVAAAGAQARRRAP